MKQFTIHPGSCKGSKFTIPLDVIIGNIPVMNSSVDVPTGIRIPPEYPVSSTVSTTVPSSQDGKLYCSSTFVFSILIFYLLKLRRGMKIVSLLVLLWAAMELPHRVSRLVTSLSLELLTPTTLLWLNKLYAMLQFSSSNLLNL